MPAGRSKSSSRARIKFLIILPLVLLPLLSPAAGEPAGEQSSTVLTALEQGLAPLGLESGEITAGFPDTADRPGADPGDYLTRKNLAGAVRELAGFESGLSGLDSPAAYLEQAGGFLGLKAASDPELERSVELEAAADSLERILPGTGQALASLVRADFLLRQALSRLTAGELEELRSLAIKFPYWEDQWPGFPVRRMLELAERVDISALLAAASSLDRAASCFRGLSPAVLSGKPQSETSPKKYRLYLTTPWGPVIVGGPGEDTYLDKPLLLVDTGGNDTYRMASSSRSAVSLVVDLAGDDRYSSGGESGPAGALAGIAWLEDLSGNDTYQGDQFSLGAAGLGVGVLVDAAGNDTYRSSALGQGASFFGLGLLLDRGGDDRYTVSFGGQGACIGGGAGLLVDLAGKDSYLSGGTYRDWREPGATKSFAQGAAAGLRPFYRGGLALLYDRSGTDSYQADYFGQGAGYWGGCGILIDGAGEDNYSAGRYAQGCGLHSACGWLSDRSGNDRYSLRGVGQGTGEDRAYGFLIERGGADSYAAEWMARGAAGTGGVGLLLELEGNDSYGPGLKALDGFGVNGWELGGLGFLIDCAGADSYGENQSGSRVQCSGEWGARVDLPAGD